MSPATRRTLVALLLLATPLSGQAKPDWIRQPLAVDPDEGAMPCDWLEVHAVREAGGGLRLAFRCRAEIDFTRGAAYSIYLDTDGKRETGYRGSSDHFPLGADYLLQGATLYRYDTAAGYGNGTDWAWVAVGPVDHRVDGEWADFTVTRDQMPLGAVDIVQMILIGDNTATDVGGNHNDTFPDRAMEKSGAGRTIAVPAPKPGR